MASLKVFEGEAVSEAEVVSDAEAACPLVEGGVSPPLRDLVTAKRKG